MDSWPFAAPRLTRQLCEHVFDVVHLGVELCIFGTTEEAEVSGEQEVVLQLFCEVRRDLEAAGEISRPRARSVSVSKPQPRAIFAGTETHERRSWLFSPHSSSFGKFAVAA